MGNLKIKRAYLAPETADGYRILIDRLWPRGISKATAAIDEWDKNIAPTTELRKWFGHQEENFEEFRKRYTAELASNPYSFQFVKHCQALLAEGNVTLVFGARSITCNHAIILRDWIVDALCQAS